MDYRLEQIYRILFPKIVYPTADEALDDLLEWAEYFDRWGEFIGERERWADYVFNDYEDEE